MRIPSWIRQVFSSRTSPITTKTRTFRPAVEFLEDRITPSGLTAVAGSFTILHDHTLTATASAGVLQNDTTTSGNPIVVSAINGDATQIGQAITLPSGSTLTLQADGSFVLVPLAKTAYTDQFTYTASDGVDTADATVTVSITNTPPVVTGDSLTVVQDHVLAAIDLSHYATDADGDALQVKVIDGPTNGQLTANSDGTYSYTPNAGYDGTDSFTIKADDGVGYGSGTNGSGSASSSNGGSGSGSGTGSGSGSGSYGSASGSFGDSNLATITINVTPVSLTSPGDQTNYDGDTVSLPLTASDAKGNTLSFTEIGLPDGLTMDSGTGKISGTIAGNADINGPFSVTVTATDSTANASASQTFAWTVNNPVRVTSPGDKTNYDGATISLPLTSSDSEGNPLSFTETGLPGGLTINPASGAISGLASSGADTSSPYSVTVTATDATANATARISFNWAINPSPVNLTSPGDQTNYDGDTVSLPLTNSDAEGNTLSFTETGLPDGLTMANGTGTISGTIAGNADINGPYSVTVTATDSTANASASQTITWTVNNPVALSSPGDQTTDDADAVSLSLSASDAEGNTLSFTATGLPNGLNIDHQTGAISGTIASTADTSSPYSVTVTATDSVNGASDTQPFNWYVNPVPTINSVSLDNYSASYVGTGSANPSPDDVLTAQVAVTNPDTDPATYQYIWTVNGQPTQTDITTNVCDTFDLTQIGDGDSGAQVGVTVNLSDNGSVVSQGTASMVDRSSPAGPVWAAPPPFNGPLNRPAAPTINFPAGTNSFMFRTSEGAPEDYFIGQVTATSTNGNLTAYSIVDGNANGWFKIDASGNIRVASGTKNNPIMSLPLTSTVQFLISVAAADAADPGRPANQTTATVVITLRPTVVITGDTQGVVAPVGGGQDNIDLKFVRSTFNLVGTLSVTYTIDWRTFDPTINLVSALPLENTCFATGQVTFAAGQSTVDVVLVPASVYYAGGQSPNFNVQLDTPAAGSGYILPPHNQSFFLPSLTMTGYDNSDVTIYDGTCLYASANDVAGLADPGDSVNINDIQQAGLGDCYFWAAVGAIAKNDPQFIHNMIQVNNNGTATINFFPSVGAAAVPITVSLTLSVGYAQANLSGDYQTSADGTHREWEIWPQVLENAYARFLVGQGGNINNGGSTYVVWQQIDTQRAYSVDNSNLTPQTITNALTNQLAQGIMLVVSTNATIANPIVSVDDGEQDLNYQVTSGHAYVVLRIWQDVDGNNILELQNPWGGDPTEPPGGWPDPIKGPVIEVPLAQFTTFFYRYQYQTTP